MLFFGFIFLHFSLLLLYLYLTAVFTTFPEKGTVTNTGRINYDMRIPLSEIGFTEETLKNGFMFKAKVFDDDGIGDDIDNWMETHHCWVKIVFQD